MRLACAVLSMIFLALPAMSREGVVNLSWSQPAEDGAEALLIVRDEDGESIIAQRKPVEVSSTTLQMELPPLPRTGKTLQSGLISEGAVALQSAIMQIAERTASDLSLTLHQSLAIGFSDHWECGDGQLAQVRQQADGLHFHHPATTTTLVAQEDRPQRFTGEDGTELRFSGNEAELTLPGQESEICRPTLFRPVLPLDAVASTAEWRIELGRDTAVIDLPGLEDETLASAGLSISAPRNGVIDIRATSLALRLTEGRCTLLDNGLIYPIEAELTLHATADVSQGCAGSPMDLLSGRSWHVISLHGIPLIENARQATDLTLQIGNGQISGRGTCNRYVGRAEIENGELAFRELGTTRLACPANLRNMELRFLDALEVASGFDISRNGMLILRAGHMPVLTAIRR